MREYYRQSGEPEDERVRQLFKNMEKEGGEPFQVESEYNERTFKKERVERVVEVLEQIDFEQLREIVSRLAERCGIPPEQLNFLDKTKINLKEREVDTEDDETIWGAYQLLSNSITIFPHNLIESLNFSVGVRIIKKMEESPNKTVSFPETDASISDEMLQFAVLRSLIHEQVHAISFTKIVTGKPESFWDKLRERVSGKRFIELSSVLSGYHKNLLKRDRKGGYQPNRNFVAFDEGVTDKLTLDLLDEYLSVKGLQVVTEPQIQLLQEDMRESTYGLCIQLVDGLIKEIAQHAHIDEKSVWNAVIRSKIEGVDLEDTEIAQFIDESTFHGFFERLKELQPKDVQNVEEVKTCLDQ